MKSKVIGRNRYVVLAGAALIEPADAGGRTLAVIVDGNPLGEPDPAAWARRAADAAAAGGVRGGRIVAWSGTLAEELFEADPRTWMRGGQEALRAFCGAVREPLRAAGARLALRPHSRHVLSDPASCSRFLDEFGEGPFELALAPAALLEPSMLEDAGDHLERALSALGARAALVLVHDAAPRGDGLAAAPQGGGVLDMAAFWRLVEAHVPAPTPVVLVE